MQCACTIFSSLVYPALKYPAVSNKRHHFQKTKLLNMKYVFSFSLQFFSLKKSHFKEKWARYDKKFLLVFVSSICYSCLILIKLEFSRQIFVKYSNIELHENPSFGCRDVPCERTDMTKQIVAFRNFATAPNMWLDVHNARSTLDCLWHILPFTVTTCCIVTVVHPSNYTWNIRPLLCVCA
jgi:hypothetical protein